MNSLIAFEAETSKNQISYLENLYKIYYFIKVLEMTYLRYKITSMPYVQV